MFVVLPSEGYENNPRTAIEAFAIGKPVVGSNIGGIPELVRNGETGFLFEPGNSVDLREKLLYMLKDGELIIEMGKKARRFVEEELNSKRHYDALMTIYQMALEKRFLN